jgi:hypothetical protein
MEVSGQFQALAAFPPRKEPQYPLDRKLEFMGKIKILLCRESNAGRLARSSVSILIELFCMYISLLFHTRLFLSNC